MLVLTYAGPRRYIRRTAPSHMKPFKIAALPPGDLFSEAKWIAANDKAFPVGGVPELWNTLPRLSQVTAAYSASF